MNLNIVPLSFYKEHYLSSHLVCNKIQALPKLMIGFKRFFIIVRNKFLTIPSKFLHVKCAEIDLEDLNKFLMPSNFILIHILKSDSNDLIHKLYCTFSESYRVSQKKRNLKSRFLYEIGRQNFMVSHTS